jgi:uncharacterized protein (TIGR02453 family)
MVTRETPAFQGFPRGTVRFLAGLSRDNSKAWFEAHRVDYEAFYLAPASALVEALAPRLRKIDASLHAVPRVNASIMRINRDVRFSKDKRPYKDHLDLWFWSGEEKGWDRSGFFFRLTPKRLILGGGMHAFTPAVLDGYRKAVLDERKGSALVKIVAKLRQPGYDIGGQTYKKTPRGIPGDHPRAELLKHGTLYASWEAKHPPELGGAKLVDLIAKHFMQVAPIHVWLNANVTAGG